MAAMCAIIVPACPTPENAVGKVVAIFAVGTLLEFLLVDSSCAFLRAVVGEDEADKKR